MLIWQRRKRCRPAPPSPGGVIMRPQFGKSQNEQKNHREIESRLMNLGPGEVSLGFGRKIKCEAKLRGGVPYGLSIRVS